MALFWMNRHKLKTTKYEHQIGARQLCPMQVSCLCVYWCDCWCCFLLDTAFILTLEKSEPKIWIHIKHCVSSAKAIPVQEAHTLYCVDAAVPDAKNLCRWCLASFVYIFWEFLFRILWNDSARRVQYATHVLFGHSTVEKEFCIHVIEICCK